jgi:uncharacterized protein (TIGR02147 family)
MAGAIPVHTTFVSQVLKGRAEFSLEQAESINAFFGHTEDEGEYFILLLLSERSGSTKLKSRFDRKIRAMREEHLNIKNRLNAESEISAKDREKFYANYIYSAVHVLSAIDEFKTAEKLAAALKISRERIQEVVEFLLKIGVLAEEKGKLQPGVRHIHLGTDSELILKHHSNWRMHAISNMQFLDRDDLHYSACLSLSVEDAFKVKDMILETLKKNVDVISKSKEEVAYVLNFDFYKLLAR